MFAKYFSLIFLLLYVTADPNFVFILTDDQDLLLNGMVSVCLK